MKKMKTILSLTVLVLIISTVNAQTFTSKTTQEYSFSKKEDNNTVIVANINGNVKVTEYSGEKVIVEVERIISAKTTERLEEGKSKVQLGVINDFDTMVFYVKGICNEFAKGKKTNNGKHFNEWSYSWNDCNGGSCYEEFDYKLNFTIKIPVGVNINASTINNGDVLIENVSGKVKANNINGAINLVNLVQEATASTINGNLDVSYKKNPETACQFYSLNGTINANFRSGLAANLAFQSFNGSFYTNIDHIDALPAALEKTVSGSGAKYKVKGNSYKVGKGGVPLSFETFNGNVYLKEITN